MKKWWILLLVVALSVGLAGCKKTETLNPDEPVTLTMWHVYGFGTESPLNDSIDRFNRTVGREQGIVISVVSVSSSSKIDAALEASANGAPGASELPDLFTAYPRVAEFVGTERLLDFSDYLSEEELACFRPDFLSEGWFGDSLLMLPIAKSTELIFLNETLFRDFSEATGVTMDRLATFEDIFSACETYYDISGGLDLLQINDFYHYALCGIEALGGSFLKNGVPDVSSDLFARIWNPMARAAVHGGLCTGDGYASDRWKTGEVIADLGSTADILYLRDYVTYADNTTRDITTAILPYPHMQGADTVAVHRGGGLFAMRSENEAKNEAAAIFAKWLTEAENNLDFVTAAGYLPVTEQAFSSLFSDTSSVEHDKYRMLYRAVGDMNCRYITPPVFEGAADVQSEFETNVKQVLGTAHAEFVRRVQSGEDHETVLNELVSDSLSRLIDLYQ